MDARAGIVDDDVHLGSSPLQSHLDRPPRGSELDRVDEQVRHDLLQTDWIAGDHGGLRIEHEVEPDPLRVSPRTDACGGGFDRGPQPHRLEIEPE